jgi:hypothetical protein
MHWKEFNTSLDEIVTTSPERLRKKLYIEAEVAARIDGYRETVPLMRLSRILTHQKYSEIQLPRETDHLTPMPTKK